jgi:glucose-1-phosphate thymidylyltransferase
MLSVGNKPILQYVVEALAHNTVQDIIIVVGYHREQIQDYFGSGERFGVHIRYATQEHQLGTGHALLCARDLAQDRFLVLPGDNIVNGATLRELVHATQDTILVKEAPGRQYGVVLIENGLVRGLVEKPPDPVSPWLNTGTYLLHGTIFDRLTEQLELPAAIHQMVQDGHRVAHQPTQGTWWDAAYPWDLLQLNGLALAEAEERLGGIREPGVVIKGRVQVAEKSVLRANTYIVGPAVIGEGCEIGPSVSIFPYTSIGNNVVIDAFTQVRNSIIGNSVQLGSHSLLRDSILADGCAIGPRFTAPSGKTVMHADGEPVEVRMGSIVADNVEIGAGVSLRPGLLIGHGAHIRDMNQLREDIPEGSLVV